MLAPIVLFVYNRPWHTRKTLESLMQNFLSENSEIFIFADGPKENASPEQLEKIKETRKLIREKNWCGKVTIIERDKNMGLANSVIAGVTEIVNKFGKIIVLEDDLILSRNFLKYMNKALNKYENEPRVMQICGYMRPIKLSIKTDCFFLPIINSTGWGTWKRVWDNFDPGNKDTSLLDKNRKLRRKFDFGGSYPFYKMLKSQINKNIDSWAIRFYLSIFMQGGLILYPRYTLVKHIGFDGSGVHCKIEIEQDDIDNSFTVKIYEDEISVSPENELRMAKFLRKQMNMGVRIFRYLNQYIIRKIILKLKKNRH
jgi:GT2 family glycosyltransferase